MRVCCWTRLDKPPAPSPEAGGTGRSLGLTQPGSTSPGWAAGLLGRAGLGLRLLAPRGSVNCARKGGPASASPAGSLLFEPPVGRNKFKQKKKKKKKYSLTPGFETYQLGEILCALASSPSNVKCG